MRSPDASRQVEDTPVAKTNLGVSTTIFDLANRTQGLVQDRNPESLIIGTHTRIPLVGDGMLSSLTYPESYRTRIVDTPEEVLSKLRMLLHQFYKRYTCVMAAFELHHFRGRDLEDLTELLSMLSHGTVIMADYTLAGVNPSVVELDTRSKVEILQQRIYGGFRKWYEDHNVFSVDRFIQVSGNSEWSSFRGIVMPQNKAVAVASPTLSQGELNQITDPAIFAADSPIEPHEPVAY